MTGQERDVGGPGCKCPGQIGSVTPVFIGFHDVSMGISGKIIGISWGKLMECDGNLTGFRILYGFKMILYGSYSDSIGMNGIL